MQSPINYRKQSVAYSTKSNSSSSAIADDKVWWPELDDVLIKSLYKYKKFKEDQDSFNASSILKKTSQNKIISRMLLNKTGILRTTKQISSRIFVYRNPESWLRRPKPCKLEVLQTTT